MKLRSYAKINITLDIKGKRSDNYHEIETIYQHINLYDEIEIYKTEMPEVVIECDIDLLDNKNNICYKTAKKGGSEEK